MGLSVNVVWEVRPGSGADTNGGGYDPSITSPGTDYSQQNSAQYAYTDGVTVGTTAFTSVSHSFVAGDVANIICISAGSGNTAGFYTIVSVAGGIATLDRSPGTGTGATWALGGSLNTVGVLFNRSPGSGYNPNSTNGGKIYMKGTQSLTSSTYIQPRYGGPTDFTLIGYGTTRGDNVQATFTINANDPCWEFGGTSGRFYNISFTTTSGTVNVGVTNSSGTINFLLFDNCTFIGFSSALSIGASQLVCINSEFKNCTADSIYMYGTAFIFGCYFHANASGAGVHGWSGNQYATLNIIDSVFYSNLYGILWTGDTDWASKQGIYCTNCAFVSNTSDAIRLFGSGTNYPEIIHLINCIIYGNGGYGINVKTGLSNFHYYEGKNNAYGSNTSGNYTSSLYALPGEVTLTANPFISAGHFTLNSTAGGGAACVAAGFQSLLIA